MFFDPKSGKWLYTLQNMGKFAKLVEEEGAENVKYRNPNSKQGGYYDSVLTNAPQTDYLGRTEQDLDYEYDHDQRQQYEQPDYSRGYKYQKYGEW
jgi:hypothetical protein